MQLNWIKALALGISFVLTGEMAFADGFTCRGVDDEATITIYRSWDNKEHKFKANTMILAAPGHEILEISKFTAERGSLLNENAYIIGLLKGSRSEGINDDYQVGPFAIGSLHAIVLDIDFSFEDHNKMLSGTVIFFLKTGERFTQDYDCQRISN